MKIELSTTEFVEIIRALFADEEPRELSDAQKKIIDDYTNMTTSEMFYLEKNNRPKAAAH